MFTRKEIFPYVVILKNSNARYANVLGFFLSMLSIIFFCGEYYINKDHSIVWLIGAAAILSVIIWNIVQERRNKKAYYKPAFIIAAIVWLSMPYLHWIAAPLVFMYFLEHQAKRPQEIGFSEEKVVFNSLFIKTIYWRDLYNVILKDDILTIDFKNNKIIQKEVLDDDDPEADEDEFNEFCRQQLKAHRY